MNNYKSTLISLSEATYKEFSSKLLPGVNNILGVRLPKIRNIAQKIAKNDYKEFLSNPSNDTFEEIMLEGMTIGYINANIDEVLCYVKNFIPKIDNWSTCDSFCSGLKITKRYPNEVWNFINPYLKSNDEYFIRFAVVVILNYYVKDEYIDDVLVNLDQIKHDGYYVKMAVAWAISICYKKFPSKTFSYLNNNTLDDFTYNKAIQKIIESLNTSKEMKDTLKTMKRK